jgi:flavorubredoxin
LGSVKVCEEIFWVGVDDRRDILFEGLWPIPYGVSYNSYIVKGSEKVALIDTVDEFYSKEFLSNIEEIVKCSEIDYIVLNHLEPDHSGALNEVLEKAPRAKVVSSQMGINFAKAYYGGGFEAMAVKDGDIIDLGGHTLKFITAPWLHWPETIFTYDINSGTLFSGDAFGTFGALNGKIFDDELNIEDFEGEMKRYFADIVSHYSQFVLKAAEKIRNIPIKILCTTHGPIYRKKPDHPIKLYLKWSSGVDENKVLILYGSMYGHTAEVAKYFEDRLRGMGVNVKLFDLCRVHPSFILPELIDSKAILLGSPTYEGTIYPPITNLIEYARIKNVRPKSFGIFANYTWGSNIIEQLKSKLVEIGMKVLEPTVLVKGRFTEEDKSKADLLIENLIKAMS